MIWHLHRWSRWMSYNHPFIIQYRRCSVCNKRQERCP